MRLCIRGDLFDGVEDKACPWLQLDEPEDPSELFLVLKSRGYEHDAYILDLMKDEVLVHCFRNFVGTVEPVLHRHAHMLRFTRAQLRLLEGRIGPASYVEARSLWGSR